MRWVHSTARRPALGAVYQALQVYPALYDRASDTQYGRAMHEKRLAAEAGNGSTNAASSPNHFGLPLTYTGNHWHALGAEGWLQPASKPEAQSEGTFHSPRQMLQKRGGCMADQNRWAHAVLPLKLLRDQAQPGAARRLPWAR